MCIRDRLLSIRAVREQVNSGLVITGLLRVKFDPRITLQREVNVLTREHLCSFKYHFQRIDVDKRSFTNYLRL